MRHHSFTKGPVVTLVHGTWGNGIVRSHQRRPRWFHADQPFACALSEALGGAPIEVLEWSGANSFAEREKASQQLAALLDGQRIRHPDRSRMIVAHSHGGNIAIACLNHVALGSEDLAIVTLATPFVEVFRSRLTDRQRQAFWYLKFMWYYVLLVAVGALLFFAVSFADRAFTLTDDAAAAVLVALVAILGALLFYGFIRLRRSLRLRGRERIARLEETTSHVVLSRFKGRFLVLRAIDDEASLVLAMGSVGTRLANLLFSLYGFNLTTVFVVSAVVLGAGELVSGGPLGRMHLDWVGDLLRVVYFAVFWIIILAPPAVLLLVLVSGAFRSVFGREIFNAPLACDVNSHSVPDISGVTVVTLRGEGAVRSLRHGLYELPGVVRVIAEWNDRRVDR